MRFKIILGGFLISLVAVALFILIKYTVGDVRPAWFPARQDMGELAHPSFSIGVFAKGLGNVRDIAFSPEGTLLVSVPASGKVVALPDRDRDGKADSVNEVAGGIRKPHGIEFFKGRLFIAEENRVARYTWDERTLTAAQEKQLFLLPLGERHVTRSLAFNKQGQLFVSLGSTCDVCFETHPFLGAVVVSNEEGENPRVFAAGLRNAVFITMHPLTDALWGTEMGRDFLGDFLPPDEINIIREGKHYGWPVCFGNKAYDRVFGKHTPEYCKTTEAPAYEIAAHSAPLGLVFINSPQFPKDWQGDLLVAYHGSWNRSTPIGYKVVRLEMEGEVVKGEEDFLIGFLQGTEALGRPVDLAFDQHGSLYISDDKAGVIYKVTTVSHPITTSDGGEDIRPSTPPR